MAFMDSRTRPVSLTAKISARELDAFRKLVAPRTPSHAITELVRKFLGERGVEVPKTSRPWQRQEEKR